MADVQGDPDEHDFQDMPRYRQYNAQDARERIALATSRVHSAIKTIRESRRRGPARTSVRMKFYLLPEGSRIPRLKGKNIDAELIATHHSCYYGFPGGEDKSISIAINATADEVQEALAALYPRLPSGIQFKLHRLENKRLVEITQPVESLYNFKGTVWVTTADFTRTTEAPQPTPISPLRPSASISQDEPPTPGPISPLRLSASISQDEPPTSGPISPLRPSASISQDEPPTSGPISPLRPSASISQDEPPTLGPISPMRPSASISQEDPPTSGPISPMRPSASISHDEPPTSGPISPLRPSASISQEDPPTSGPISPMRHSASISQDEPPTSGPISPIRPSASISQEDPPSLGSLSPLRPPRLRLPRSGAPVDQHSPGSMSPLRVRRDLIAAQDLEFAESVARDLARTREMEAATDERRRQRTERQTNRQNRRLALHRIGTEPDEGPSVVQVVIELPARSIQRRFNISDTCADIYRFVQGSSLLDVRSIRLGTVLLPDAPETLEDQGIMASVRLHADLCSESSSGTDTEDEQPIASLVVRSLSDIRERAFLIRDRLLPPTQVSVRRTHVIEDVLGVYRDEEVIDQVHRQVRFNFVGEPALDLEGVSRSVFSLFFNTLFDSVYFSGNTELIPQLHHRVLFTGFYEVIGRIISHAFVLVGYFPTRLCRAVVMYILTRKCPTQYVRDSFLRFLPQSESRVIQKLLNGDEVSALERETLVRCFSHHDGMEMPTYSNIASLLDDVACVSLLGKPLLPISQMAIGMRCFPLLWQGIRPSIIDELYSTLQPSADEILQLINAQFCYDEESIPDEHQRSMRALEEQVYEYLQRYISGLSSKSLELLLMFWTGCDLLIVSTLTVSFNSLEGEQRRPIANTCASQLTLSRFYMAFQDFATELDLYLHDPRSMTYDSV